MILRFFIAFVALACFAFPYLWATNTHGPLTAHAVDTLTNTALLAQVPNAAEGAAQAFFCAVSALVGRDACTTTTIPAQAPPAREPPVALPTSQPPQSPQPQTIIQRITEPVRTEVVERVIETREVVREPTLTREEFEAALNALRSELSQRTTQTAFPRTLGSAVAPRPSTWGLTQRIDNLGDVDIQNSRITNSTVSASSLTVSGSTNLASLTVTDTFTAPSPSFTGTTALAALTLSGALHDSTGSPGTAGHILQTTGTSTQWVATSTLGITGGGGGSGITSLNGLTNTTQTFATSSDTNIGLTITSSGATHTFAPTWSGALAVARGGTGTSTLPAGEILLGNGTGTIQSVSTLSAAFIDDTFLRNDQNDTTSGILTAGGFTTTGTSTAATSSVDALVIGGDTLTELVGTGLQLTNGILQTTLGTAIDISDDTNLTGDSEIVLTNDTLSIAASIARDSELHNPVTLAGSYDYLTLFGQELTLGLVDVSDDTNLSVIATGLELSGDALTLSSGFQIPLSASTTQWATAYGWGDHSTAGYLTSITGESLESLSDVASFTQSTGDLLQWNGTAWTNAATSSLGIGGGSSLWTQSGSDIYYTTGSVGIGDTTPSRRLDVFHTASNPQFRISYDASTFTDFTVSATGDLSIDTSGDDVNLFNENLRICAGGACPADSSTLAGNGNIVAENRVFAEGFEPATCPAGMIPVPAMPEVGLYTGFCVDKYEAKNVGGIATSQAAGTPWVSITQYDARVQCRRAGKTLITEQQWMAIARNVEDVGWNWNSGVAGTNQMSDGHSDNSPGGALAAAADTDPCSGTGQTCSTTTWNTQRRTYQLSNGEYIWDFGGNVWEWVDQINHDDYPVDNTGTAQWVACATTGDGICGNMLTTNDQWYRGNTSATRAFLRGGDWYNGTQSGAFTLALNDAPTNAWSSGGFRCAR